MHEGSLLIPKDHEEKNVHQDSSMKTNAWLILGIQIVLIVLYGTATDPYSEIFSPSDDFSTEYLYYLGVIMMMVIGFAYLMSFMPTYQLTAVGLTLLVTCIGVQWAIFTNAFFSQLYAGVWDTVSINIFQIMVAAQDIAAVLISFGGIIGKVTPLQLTVVTVLELVFYSFNKQVILLGALNIADCGGTIIIHEFGAYFGLSVAFMLGVPSIPIATAYYPDVFSLIGTIILFVFWPSFVAGGLEANSEGQQRALINTILALMASTASAFAFSTLFNKQKKFGPVDIQNATLAGGVAIGAIADLTLSPFTAPLVGLVAVLVSCYGFHVLQSYLEEHWGLHDSCGINNLHGMPSLIGATASIILAAYKVNVGHDSSVYGTGDSVQYQALWQFLGMFGTFFFAILSGLFTGWLIRLFDVQTLKSTLPFDDRSWWESEPPPHLTNDKTE